MNRMRLFMFAAAMAVTVVLAGGRLAISQEKAQDTAQDKKAMTPMDVLREQIVAKERQELDALKSGNAQEFASLIAEEAVFVDPRGTAGKAEVVQHVTDFKLLEYSMTDVRFVPLSAKS